MRIGRRRRIDETRPFEPDADALESLPLPFPGRTILYLMMGLILAAVLWASLSHVDRVVTAPGRLVTTAPKAVVQPLETSIIKALHVREGDRVKAGQVLATLDPTFLAADFATLAANRERVAAQIARLEAELAGKDYRPSKRSEAADSQRSIHEQKQATMTARLTSFDRKADELRAGKRVNARRMVRIRDQLRVTRELESIRSRLFERKVGSHIDLLNVQAERFRLLEELEALEERQVEIDNRLKSNVAERELYVRADRHETLKELVEARKQLDTLDESLTKTTRRQAAERLTAPHDAVVFEVAERSVGSILKEAEPLMTLVPADSGIELLVELTPRDIGRVKVGDPCRIKIDAFPFQIYGTLGGRLRTISSDAFVENSRADRTLSYRAQIALDESDFSRRAAESPLRPGMTGTAEIVIGRRSVISFLLYPVIRTLDEAAREP